MDGPLHLPTIMLLYLPLLGNNIHYGRFVCLLYHRTRYRTFGTKRVNVFIANQSVHIRLKGLVFHAIAQAGYAGFKSVFLSGLRIFHRGCQDGCQDECQCLVPISLSEPSIKIEIVGLANLPKIATVEAFFSGTLAIVTPTVAGYLAVKFKFIKILFCINCVLLSFR